MRNIMDVAVTLAYVLLLTAGGTYAAKKTFKYVQKAAITKVAQGLPQLSKFKYLKR